MARRLGDGHRLFSGVAGSGKTLILIARAKFLANKYPNYKVLILCYNKSLAAYLRSLTYSEEYPVYQEKIQILHFHAWVKSILGKVPVAGDYSNEQDWHQSIGRILCDNLNKSSEKWDAILVDEAHTFAPEWFRCCVAALKEGENGHLLIVSDGNQKIYKRKVFSWKSVGIRAQGRTKILKLNYRNTREILEAAWKIMSSSQVQDSLGNSEPTFPLISPQASHKRGPKPVLHLTQSLKQSIRIVLEQINSLKRNGFESRDIAVVFHNRAIPSQDWLPKLKTELKASGIDTYWISNKSSSKENYSVNAPGVRFVSAQSALGLEFKAVLIMGLERFVDNHEDEAIQKRQLYVSMTRAQDRLHILGASTHPLTQELKKMDVFDIG